jgi:phosphoglycerate kinase
MINKKTLNNVDLKNKTVIVRLDLNVPIKDGKIVDDKRITAAIPTLEKLIKNNCKIIVLSHLSRVSTLADKTSGKKSLAPVAIKLQELLPQTKVSFINKSVGQEVIDAKNKLQPQEILVLENTRYNDVDENGVEVKKESKCDNELGQF